MADDLFQQNTSSTMIVKKWQNLRADLVAGITTRLGGKGSPPFDTLNMAFHVDDDEKTVIKNRHIVSRQLHTPLDEWICCDQVHRTSIHKIIKQDKGKGAFHLETAVPKTDGLYTKAPGILLGLCFADCVPIYICAPKHGIVGLAHAGWRGTVGNIAGQMVERWTDTENIPVDDIYVIIGPSIGTCCYEVDERVIQQVDQVLDTNVKRPYRKTETGHYHLDLRECNRQLLIKKGISVEHIECSRYCTSCRTDLFYSHRKEQGNTGRMLAFIRFGHDNKR